MPSRRAPGASHARLPGRAALMAERGEGTPHPADGGPVKQAVVAVLRDADRVLVILRGGAVPSPGYWAPLSGRIESGESQEEALVREVREEVGLEVRPIEKVWECPTDDQTYRLHWWTADLVGGKLELNALEVDDARWVTAQEFDELEPTFALDREFFRRVLPGLP